MLAYLFACNDNAPPPEKPATEVSPPVEAPPAADMLPAELPVGVREVPTPDGLARMQDRVDHVPPRHLEVRVDFASGDFATLRARLEGWGFTIEDGDGASLRVTAPAGDHWAERLEPLPTIARVAETLTQDKLPDGAVRGGTARFGTAAYTWALKDGKLVESTTGAALPAAAELPRTVPVAVVRCLAPIRTAMLDGETAGPGWERALHTESNTWAIVVEHFGACDATGWVLAKADAKSDTLTVAGKPVKELDDATLFGTATRYLSTERAASDEGAAAAVDILRRGDDAQLSAAIGAIAPGPQQERLLLALAERDQAKALALASTSTSPTLRGWAAGVDATARQSVLADTGSSPDALVFAMSAWRPGAADAATLDRLRAHPDPRVRMRAWDLALDAGQAACLTRAPGAKTLTLDDARKLYAECPQQPVRLQAFGRAAQLDKAAAGELVAGTLAAPETVRTGINAVRFASTLERDDLLEAAVSAVTLDRDVRASALRALLATGRSPAAAALAEKHGPFLGVKPGEKPSVVDGEAPKKKRRR